MTEDAANNGAPNGAPAHDAAGNVVATPDSAALEAARREAAENWDRYVRAAAELDNLMKRNAREVENARKFGAERLAQALLPVRDSLEAALATADNVDLPTLLEGQRAIFRLLDEAFEAGDIRVIDPLGEPFDPSKHEAISVVPSPTAEPNSVVHVMRKGYELKDRLLRPAQVIVAREPGEGGNA